MKFVIICMKLLHQRVTFSIKKKLHIVTVVLGNNFSRARYSVLYMKNFFGSKKNSQYYFIFAFFSFERRNIGGSYVRAAKGSLLNISFFFCYTIFFSVQRYRNFTYGKNIGSCAMAPWCSLFHIFFFFFVYIETKTTFCTSANIIFLKNGAFCFLGRDKFWVFWKKGICSKKSFAHYFVSEKRVFSLPFVLWYVVYINLRKERYFLIFALDVRNATKPVWPEFPKAPTDIHTHSHTSIYIYLYIQYT